MQPINILPVTSFLCILHHIGPSSSTISFIHQKETIIPFIIPQSFLTTPAAVSYTDHNTTSLSRAIAQSFTMKFTILIGAVALPPCFLGFVGCAPLTTTTVAAPSTTGDPASLCGGDGYPTPPYCGWVVIGSDCHLECERPPQDKREAALTTGSGGNPVEQISTTGQRHSPIMGSGPIGYTWPSSKAMPGPPKSRTDIQIWAPRGEEKREEQASTSTPTLHEKPEPRPINATSAPRVLSSRRPSEIMVITAGPPSIHNIAVPHSAIATLVSSSFTIIHPPVEEERREQPSRVNDSPQGEYLHHFVRAGPVISPPAIVICRASYQEYCEATAEDVRRDLVKPVARPDPVPTVPDVVKCRAGQLEYCESVTLTKKDEAAVTAPPEHPFGSSASVDWTSLMTADPAVRSSFWDSLYSKHTHTETYIQTQPKTAPTAIQTGFEIAWESTTVFATKLATITHEVGQIPSSHPAGTALSSLESQWSSRRIGTAAEVQKPHTHSHYTITSGHPIITPTMRDESVVTLTNALPPKTITKTTVVPHAASAPPSFGPPKKRGEADHSSDMETPVWSYPTTKPPSAEPMHQSIHSRSTPDLEYSPTWPTYRQGEATYATVKRYIPVPSMSMTDSTHSHPHRPNSSETRAESTHSHSHSRSPTSSEAKTESTHFHHRDSTSSETRTDSSHSHHQPTSFEKRTKSVAGRNVDEASTTQGPPATESCNPSWWGILPVGISFTPCAQITTRDAVSNSGIVPPYITSALSAYLSTAIPHHPKQTMSSLEHASDMTKPHPPAPTDSGNVTLDARDKCKGDSCVGATKCNPGVSDSTVGY